MWRQIGSQKLKRTFRVETPSTSISEFLFLDCQRNFHDTLHGNEIHIVRKRMQCSKSGPISTLCFPTFLNDKQSLEKDSPGPSEKNVECSFHMVVSSMVPNTSENVNRETTSFATPTTLSSKLPGADTSINNKQNIKISGLEGFRQRLLATGISERASKLALSTRRQGSLSNYNSSWSKWASSCGERKIDPFQYAIGKLLNYLSYLFDLGYEYRTVSYHRSKISAYHEYVDNKPVGQHPHVCVLLKWVLNQRPPQPRYVLIWYIQIVLDFVKCQ